MKSKKSTRIVLSFLLILSLLFGFTACNTPQEEEQNETSRRAAVLERCAAAMLAKNQTPVFGPVGGEWMAFGLSRWGGEMDSAWFESYYEALEQYVTECEGILDTRKYTEYSRVILAVTAMGKDPSDVAGYNLLEPLADFDQTIFQGINGPVYALLALDSADYEMPVNLADTTQATKEMYIDYILSKELPEGGWTLSGGTGDVDITAMVLQALAKYQDRQDVKEAVERGLSLLSSLQNEEAGFSSFDTESSESISQVIVALVELGIDITDSRFVKNEKTMEDRLMEFAAEDGGFRHILDGDSNQMATEQAFYALVALERMEQGKSSLFDMIEKAEGEAGICTISITCATILDNMADLAPAKTEFVPENGWVLQTKEVSFEEGETVHDVLKRVCMDQKIHMESSYTPVYDSAYVEGISQLYEFDCGSESGWMYKVNGEFPNYGCSQYQVAAGDSIEWVYTCNLGDDVGNSYMKQEEH